MQMDEQGKTASRFGRFSQKRALVIDFVEYWVDLNV
jgi:hypothetical protein